MPYSKNSFPKPEICVQAHLPVSFRQALRSLVLLSDDDPPHRPSSEYQPRLLRAFLTFGVLLKFSFDKRLHQCLRAAELSIDLYDLAVEVPDRADVGIILPDTSTALLQHLPTWWIASLEGAPTWNEEEKLLNLASKCPSMLPKGAALEAVKPALDAELESDKGSSNVADLDDLLSWPLFRAELSKDFWRLTRVFQAAIDELFGESSFWREWYQGFLDGKPLDWELQRRVALIPDADWEQGPEHIAKLIEEIRARFELEKRIAALEEELRATSMSRHGIGGNFPPEPVDEAVPVAKELLIIWKPLQEIKEELEADKPDAGRIRKALDLLATALKSGTVWCAKKADLAVDSAIKWAIPAGGGYLALNPEKLEAVIEAGKALLKALL